MSAETEDEAMHYEKSVEWYYVKKYFEGEFGAPLAGKLEIVGDALIASGAKFLLIEFKRDKASISSEVTKFPDEPSARGAFLTLKNDYAKEANASVEKKEPHALVYGNPLSKEVSGHSIQVLNDLIAIRYWGAWCASIPCGRGELKRSGSIENQPANIKNLVGDLGRENLEGADGFESYMVSLIKAKGGDAEAAKGLWKYAKVVGLAIIDGQACSVIMTVWEYAIARRMYPLCAAFEAAHQAEASSGDAYTHVPPKLRLF